jgi:hypothetical protein
VISFAIFFFFGVNDLSPVALVTGSPNSFTSIFQTDVSLICFEAETERTIWGGKDRVKSAMRKGFRHFFQPAPAYLWPPNLST